MNYQNIEKNQISFDNCGKIMCFTELRLKNENFTVQASDINKTI